MLIAKDHMRIKSKAQTLPWDAPWSFARRDVDLKETVRIIHHRNLIGLPSNDSEYTVHPYRFAKSAKVGFDTLIDTMGEIS